MIRVLVVDDFPLVREANVAALERHPDVEVVGVGCDGVEAVEQACALEPDVVVLDLHMPRMSGFVALSRIRALCPATRVLLLSASEDPDVVFEAMADGAAGFLTKRIDGRELADAVVRVHDGESIVPPLATEHLFRGLLEGGPDGGRPSLSRLTSSELEVLRLVADGCTDLEISAALYMSPRTIQTHLSRIRAKTGVRRRSELSRWAAEHFVT
jgi:DNA-binding NarL/FixJ family response regulator